MTLLASDNIGPHLLGRRFVADDRDWALAPFLELDSSATLFDKAAAAVLADPRYDKRLKNWVSLATQAVDALGPAPTPSPTPTPTPTPAPVPPSPASGVSWIDSDPTLDQGQTPHCVGFGWCQWGNTQPVDDHFLDSDGDDVYDACKVIDGDTEDGSTVRSGATVMRNRKRLNAYAFAATIDEAEAWLRKNGPLVMGTDWTNDMFDVDARGYVAPTGGVAGGHCYVWLGVHDPGATLANGGIAGVTTYEYLNSWGEWGINNTGHFYMRKSDAKTLFAQQGEVCAAIELG